MAEKPRCATCCHHVAAMKRCEQSLPEVLVNPTKAGQSEERSLTAWRVVEPTDGCANHQDFDSWLIFFKSQILIDKANQGFDVNSHTPLGPYNCPCVKLQKSDNVFRKDINYQGRALSSDTTCRICRGTGIVPKEMMDEVIESSDNRLDQPVRVMTDKGASFALDENGDVVMTGAR